MKMEDAVASPDGGTVKVEDPGAAPIKLEPQPEEHTNGHSTSGFDDIMENAKLKVPIKEEVDYKRKCAESEVEPSLKKVKSEAEETSDESPHTSNAETTPVTGNSVAGDAKSDPLGLLVEYTVNKSEVVARGDQFIFGEVSFPRTVKTSWVMCSMHSCKVGYEKEFYTLECLVFLLQCGHLPYRGYVNHANSMKKPCVRQPDYDKLLAYLNGRSPKQPETEISNKKQKKKKNRNKDQPGTNKKKKKKDKHKD